MKKFKALIRAGVCAVIAVLVFVLGKMKLPELFKDPDLWPKMKRALLILVILLAAEGLIQFLLGLIKPKKNRTRTVIALIKNVLRYAVILAAICVVLTLFVDLGTVFAGLGIVALIIGFGAESLIADVVTGMFILIDNQYNVGDIIEINGFRGTVTDISVRTTVLTDVGGNVKIINNSDMKNILNRSDNSSRAVAVFPIPYETDLEALEEKLPALMQSIYDAHSDLMKSAPKYLGVDELADSSVMLKFVVEVAEPDIYSGARVLNRELFVGMRKLGVEVPFPQVDVHQK